MPLVFFSGYYWWGIMVLAHTHNSLIHPPALCLSFLFAWLYTVIPPHMNPPVTNFQGCRHAFVCPVTLVYMSGVMHETCVPRLILLDL